MITSTQSVNQIYLRDIIWLKEVGKRELNCPAKWGEVRSFFTSDDECIYYRLSAVTAVVLKSKVYVIHGCKKRDWLRGRNPREVWGSKPAVMHCLDSAKNEWEQKNVNPASSFWIQSFHSQ